MNAAIPWPSVIANGDGPRVHGAPGEKVRQEASSHSRSVRDVIDEILLPWKQHIQKGQPLTDEDYDRLRYKALEEKHFDRR